jgi:hypothetical protein
MNDIQGGRVTCYLDDIRPLRSFGEGQGCHRQPITDLLSLFFGEANEIDVLNAPITIPSPAGADEDMLTESGILSLSTPNYASRRHQSNRTETHCRAHSIG